MHRYGEEAKRYTQDNYYKKGQFSVRFVVVSAGDESSCEDLRECEPLNRALKALLYALRDETKLKISAFIDLWQPEVKETEEREASLSANDDDAGDPPPDGAVMAEFVVFNKLSSRSVRKLQRFLDEHFRGTASPHLVLVDGETSEKFDANHFVIQFLFHDFIANAGRNNWDDLAGILSTPDRGYAQLNRLASVVRFHGALYVPWRTT